MLEATFLRLGFPSLNPFAFQFNTRTLLPHLVTPILFLGPVFTGYLGGELPGQRNWMWRTHVVARFFRIQGFRNYCIVGCLCILYVLSDYVNLINMSTGTYHRRNRVSSLRACYLPPIRRVEDEDDLPCTSYFWFG